MVARDGPIRPRIGTCAVRPQGEARDDGPSHKSAGSRFGRTQCARRGQARDGLHQSNHRNNVGSIPNPETKIPPSGGVSASPGEGDGGQGRNRTIDTRIFSPLLYQLSYLAILSNCRAKAADFQSLPTLSLRDPATWPYSLTVMPGAADFQPLPTLSLRDPATWPYSLTVVPEAADFQSLPTLSLARPRYLAILRAALHPDKNFQALLTPSPRRSKCLAKGPVQGRVLNRDCQS